MLLPEWVNQMYRPHASRTRRKNAAKLIASGERPKKGNEDGCPWRSAMTPENAIDTLINPA